MLLEGSKSILDYGLSRPEEHEQVHSFNLLGSRCASVGGWSRLAIVDIINSRLLGANLHEGPGTIGPVSWLFTS